MAEPSGADCGLGGWDADETFVRAVYGEQGWALLGYAGWLVADRDRAEDIVAQTLLWAWRHARRLPADVWPLRLSLFAVVAQGAVIHTA